MRTLPLLLVIACTTTTALSEPPAVPAGPVPAAVPFKPEITMTMSLTSPAFDHGGAIPRVHTCQGEDRSPALRWSGVPEGTRSLTLIVGEQLLVAMDGPVLATAELVGTYQKST